MTEETVEMIRESSRTTLEDNRRRLRDEETDVRRSLAIMRLSTEPVADLAKKLKSKSVTAKELCTLKNALVNDKNNIEVVLHEHGALRGLVRELLGHNAKKQCEAAGCLCNLALGDTKAGAAVAKSTGPYVIALLDNLNTGLSLTGAWTLGNLAGSGKKACDLLVAQGAIAKLSDLMLSAYDADIKEAAVKALIQFTIQLKTSLRSEHLERIQAALAVNDITPHTLHLMFILSCNEHCNIENIPTLYVEKLLNSLPSSIETYFTNTNTENLLFLLRIFANFGDFKTYESLLNYFELNSHVAKQLLDSNLKETMLWLLGNMFNCYPDKVLKLLT